VPLNFGGAGIFAELAENAAGGCTWSACTSIATPLKVCHLKRPWGTAAAAVAAAAGAAWALAGAPLGAGGWGCVGGCGIPGGGAMGAGAPLGTPNWNGPDISVGTREVSLAVALAFALVLGPAALAVEKSGCRILAIGEK
jgi:hypothetical protein